MFSEHKKVELNGNKNIIYQNLWYTANSYYRETYSYKWTRQK